MHAHDGYKPHSHEVRADHMGVERVGQITDRRAMDSIAELLRFAHKEPPLSHEAVAHMIRGLDAIIAATGRETGQS